MLNRNIIYYEELGAWEIVGAASAPLRTTPQNWPDGRAVTQVCEPAADEMN